MIFHSLQSHSSPQILAFGLSLMAVTAVAAQPTCNMGSNDVPSVTRKSLVITSKDGVDLSGFSLERVLGQIVKTSDIKNSTGIADSEAERVALLQTLLRSLRRTSFVNRDANVAMPTQPRPEEAKLTPNEIFDDTPTGGLPAGLHPVALFNRLDLAPRNFANCGEHRIVYMLGNGQQLDRRMTLIFEARVENPQPEKGHLGCLPIAQFWKSLEQKTAADIKSALEGMYFQGKLGNGQPDLSRPVVHFINYGFDRGQVRANLFVTPNINVFKWQLREWHTDLNPDGSPYFRVEPVKDSPLNQLWTALAPSSPFIDLQKGFQRDLLTANLARLLQPEQKPAGDEVEFVSLIAAEFANQFNGFTSVSQGDEDNPAALAAEPLRSEIASRLDTQFPGIATRPSVDHILVRAGAVTCGGCHNFSGGKPIGVSAGGQIIEWPRPFGPKDFGFVHTGERGELSPALMERFLVDRCRSLTKFIDDASTFAMTPGIATPSSISTPLADEIGRIQSLPTAAERLEGISKLEVRSGILRQLQRREPGAFVPFRRVH